MCVSLTGAKFHSGSKVLVRPPTLALKESLAHWRSTEGLATAVLVATHPPCCCVDKGSLEEKKVGDPAEVLSLLSLVLGPGTSHLTWLGLSFLLDKESKFGISSLQDFLVLENLHDFFFFLRGGVFFLWEFWTRYVKLIV